MLFKKATSGNIFYRELLFEWVRKINYPNLPSRMRSTFVYKTKEDAERATSRTPYGPEHIYRVNTLGNPCLQFSADMAWIDAFADNIHSFDGAEEFVKKYWRGEKYFDTEKSIMEVLVDCDIVVAARTSYTAENGLKTT